MFTQSHMRCVWLEMWIHQRWIYGPGLESYLRGKLGCLLLQKIELQGIQYKVTQSHMRCVWLEMWIHQMWIYGPGLEPYIRGKLGCLLLQKIELQGIQYKDTNGTLRAFFFFRTLTMSSSVIFE